jgi:hypothetical protein
VKHLTDIVPMLGWTIRLLATSRKRRLLAIGLCAAILDVALAASVRAELVAAPGATCGNFEVLLPRVSAVEHSRHQTGRLLAQLDEVLAQETRKAHESASEGSTMTEHRETYKGREIVVRPRAHEADAARAAAAPAEPELFIDNQPVFTIQNSSGAYIASGFAFDPQPSLVELAKRMIDHGAVQ